MLEAAISKFSGAWRSLDASLTPLPTPVVAQKPAVTPPAPKPVDEYLTIEDLTDKGNANLMIRLAGGNLRYIPETKQWLRWTGERWEIDEYQVFVNKYALEVARVYYQQSIELRNTANRQQEKADVLKAQTETLTDNKAINAALAVLDDLTKQVAAMNAEAAKIAKWAMKCRNQTGLTAMITQARATEGVPLSASQLDRKRHLLGVANGVVNLKTCELQKESRDDYITKRCAFAYTEGAAAARFIKFIHEITGSPIEPERNEAGEVIAGTVGRYTPRPKLAAYLLRVLGYFTTGETNEHKFFIFTGEGSNGKNVLVDVLHKILGPYAQTVPASLLLAQKNSGDAERPTPVLAGLIGVRFAALSETAEGQKLDKNVIKQHTGDRTIRARGMRENGGEQEITHKLALSTNAPPAIDHLDDAARDRITSIPFSRRWNRPSVVKPDPALPTADKGLTDYLIEREAEGILALLVQCAAEYYAHGLNPPAEVVIASTAYFNTNDQLGHWLTLMQKCPAAVGMSAGGLFGMFSAWCRENDREVSPNNETAFGLALGKRGYEKRRTNQGNVWGLRTLSVPAPPAEPYTVIHAKFGNRGPE